MGWTLAATSEEARLSQKIAYLLAASTTFCTLTGAASAAAALAFIHVEANDRTGIATRPRAIIDVETEEYGSGLVALNDFQSRGAGVLSFEFVPSTIYKNMPWDQQTEFLNRVGAIKEEMLALSGTSPGGFSGQSHFAILGFVRIAGPTFIPAVPKSGDEEAMECFMAAEYRIEG